MTALILALTVGFFVGILVTVFSILYLVDWDFGQ